MTDHSDHSDTKRIRPSSDGHPDIARPEVNASADGLSGLGGAEIDLSREGHSGIVASAANPSNEGLPSADPPRPIRKAEVLRLDTPMLIGAAIRLARRPLCRCERERLVVRLAERAADDDPAAGVALDWLEYRPAQPSDNEDL